MLLNDFTKMVDNCLAIIDNCSTTVLFNSLVRYPQCSIENKLYDIISKTLTVKNSKEEDLISKIQLSGLQSELIYNYVLYKKNPVVYLEILKVINDSCRAEVVSFPSFSKTEKWKKAIINCKNFNTFSPNIHSISLEKIRENYPEDFDRAISVSQLVEMGCDIEIINSEIHIKNGLEKTINELNKRIKKIGGIYLAKEIFNRLNQYGYYSERFERFFITREASGISFEQTPQIPFGYLLNLSLKYPYENKKIKRYNTLLREIINLSIIITNGVYGVQYYNYFKYFFQSGETIVEFLTKIVLWDSIFSIPQSRPSTALEITNKLFSFITNVEFQKIFGFTKDELIQTSNTIHLVASKSDLPTIISPSKLSKKLYGIEIGTILNILIFLSHLEPVNNKYFLPSDYSSIDFFFKPLIRLGSKRFLLMNKSWCAPNYFEAVASELRKHISQLDSKIGNQLEIFLQNKLTQKGILFSTGNYRVDGIDGECDLIIESKNAIILIEFKKKVLTRKSKSGIDINILLDLSDSILSAQLQAGRTEIVLREKGHITLKSKDGKSKTVSLNGRKIERVALTQLEYGGFQDRIIIKQFLKSLLTHSFGTYSKDTNIVKKFEKLQEKQKIWVQQYNKLLKIDKGFTHSPFFNCWFMSLPQLLEVISLSRDNNSFYDFLSKTKHITMNTLDWYREFDVATKIHDK